MNKFLRYSNRFLGILLCIFALLNVKFLFIYTANLPYEFENILTLSSAYILGLYLIIGFINPKNLRYQLRYALIDIVFIIILFAIPGSNRVFQNYLLLRQTLSLILYLLRLYKNGQILTNLKNNPPVILLFSFFVAIVLGATLLMIPTATVAGERTSFMGALFTSTSATCVTGLIVYDTGTHFTVFGQLIILMLLQVGGLGIMTISSAFAVIMGQKMSLRKESMMQSMVGGSNKLDMKNLVRSIIFATIIIELIGAAILFLTFHNEFDSLRRAIYYSVFHSVSAFCNAGFSLFENSLMDYEFSLNINLVISSLIIMGGIGFPVLSDVKRNMLKRNSFKRLTLHSKIVLTTTLSLLVIGLIGFFIAEYQNIMSGYSFSERLFSSFFQSVTTRTAGFNTIDNGLLSKGSVMLSLVLMFIGASPGSTGGGVKTTAMAVIVVSVFAMFGKNRDVNIYKRRVPDSIIKRVMALIAIAIIVLFIMTFMLFLTDDFSFEKTLFEAVSAFGTVGLSMGITSQLSSFGKIIIISLMYLGRVGPLTLIFAISETQEKSNFKFSEEKFSIG